MATAPHRNGGRHYCCRNGRSLMYSQPEQACPGKAFSIRASTVDNEVWAEVAEVAKDTDKVQRLLESRRMASTTKLEAAQQEAEDVEADIAKCKADLAKAERRMKSVEDDNEYAMWREEWKKQTSLLAQLEKRQKRTAATVTIRYANLEVLKEKVRRISNQLAGRPADYVRTTDKSWMEEAAKGTVAWAQQRGMPLGWDNQEGFTLDEGFTPDLLANASTEDKRDIMKLLGVEVLMYPSDHEYVSQTGKRYKVRYTPEKDEGTHIEKGTSSGPCAPPQPWSRHGW
jgi:hypothetical protein